MDVNGTRFQLLLGEGDWAACSDGRVKLRPEAEGEEAADLLWNRERSELTLRPLLFQFAAPPQDTPPSLSVRRGAGRDRHGNWYWVDEDGRRLFVRRESEQTVCPLWPPEETEEGEGGDGGEFRPVESRPARPLSLRGLAVTEDQFLVVGTLEPAGLLVFDLFADDPPLRILWPAAVPFAPFDMAPAPGGGLWILDREHRRFWALDRRFNVIPVGQEETTLEAGGRDDFQPRGAPAPERRTEARTFPAGVALEHASPLAAEDPIAIEALPDGTVLVLDRNPGGRFSLVRRYGLSGPLGHAVSAGRMERLMQPSGRGDFRLVAHDFAYVPAHVGSDGRVTERLYLAAEDGNQVFAFAVSEQDGQLELEPLPDYLPMRMFGGKGLVAAGSDLFYDFNDGWIPLVEQKRPRYLQQATLYTPLGTEQDEADPAAARAFDGREPDCVWHRLMLDACLPPETEVVVESRAANDERALAGADWRPEPRLYFRGASELPFAPRPTAGGDGTWELLFQAARGRFLQLRLTLKGNGRNTPRLRALRAYYPRFSYLEHYMPAVYREDPASASFLDRFLANFEGIYTALEDRVAAAQMLFDVRSAPADALEWLGGWMGVALDPTWDEPRRRLFIKHAPAFFRARGTVRGLQMALRLALDDCPSDEIFGRQASARPRPGGIRIVERFRSRRLPGVTQVEQAAGTCRPDAVQPPPTRWRPEQGRGALHALYKSFLTAGPSTTGLVFGEYRLLPPPGEAEAWTRFSRETLGFVPSVTAAQTAVWQGFLKRRYQEIGKLNLPYKTSFNSFAQIIQPGDLPAIPVRLKDWLDFLAETEHAAEARPRALWQNFLARRYHRVSRLNAAYGTHWPSFSAVSVPEELPADGAPLADWYQFEGIVLPMHEAAHRFTVLLPMRRAAAPDTAEEERRRQLAERIVELEKPAHTVFDMKFYWELFRLGEARLGEDTVVELGGRAPQLMAPLALGQERLSESYLTARRQTPADRQVLGRDPLAG